MGWWGVLMRLRAKRQIRSSTHAWPEGPAVYVSLFQLRPFALAGAEPWCIEVRPCGFHFQRSHFRSDTAAPRGAVDFCCGFVIVVPFHVQWCDSRLAAAEIRGLLGHVFGEASGF